MEKDLTRLYPSQVSGRVEPAVALHVKRPDQERPLRGPTWMRASWLTLLLISHGRHASVSAALHYPRLH